MDTYRSTRHVHLFREDGSKVEQAILDLPDAIWTADQRTMTVLFHPGRLKTGLYAKHRLGPALAPGSYRVQVSGDLKCIQNAACFNGASFRVNVRAPITSPLPILSPTILETELGSRRVVGIETMANIDFLSACNSIAAETMAGKRLRVSLEPVGSRIVVYPVEPWPESRCVIRFLATLEDVCGNRQNELFESAFGSASGNDRI